MDKKKLLILGVAGAGLYLFMKNNNVEQEQQTISGGGGGYSASIAPQEPAGLGSAQPTIIYETNLEAPVFPTGETASGTTTSKKVSTSAGGTPVKTGTPVYNPSTKTYTFFEGTPKSVQDTIISTTERQIASAPANNPAIVNYVKKQTQQPAQPTYNWAQRTAGQAYTGYSRLVSNIKRWF